MATIQCFEPNGRPILATLNVSPGDSFSMYLLEDAGTDGPRGLRSTILRPRELGAPPDATWLFDVKVDPTPGGGVTLRVSESNSKIENMDIIRPDLKSQVTRGTVIKSGSRFEVTLQDFRAVSFSIQIAAELQQGAQAMVGGGSGARRAAALAAATSAAWLIPTATAVFADPLARVMGAIRAFFKRLGISPGMFSVLLMALSLGVVALWQYREASEAEEAADAAEEALAMAEASVDAALEAEAACLAERADLADALGEREEELKAYAQESLAKSFARTIALEVGGARMGTDEAIEYDDQGMAEIQKMTIVQMKKLRDAPAEAERCLSQEIALGQDLPKFVLLWHPDPELVCPLEYAAVEGGVSRMGSWGLSERVAREFGPPPLGAENRELQFGDPLTDERMKDRWSSQALSIGLREIMKGMLEAETDQQPPVPPGQSHLWGLTFFYAYNSMPSPADGVMNLSASECVETVIGQIAAGSDPAGQGQAVMPDVSMVATEEVTLVITPTAGCPWQPGSFKAGAEAAIRTAAHYGNYLDAKANEGEGDG